MTIRNALFILIAILLFIFYWLFELQNGWTYNEETFNTLQFVAIAGIITTALLFLWSTTMMFSAAPLALAFIIISLISKSAISLFSVAANLAIIISVFFIALVQRTLNGDLKSS